MVNYKDIVKRYESLNDLYEEVCQSVDILFQDSSDSFSSVEVLKLGDNTKATIFLSKSNKYEADIAHELLHIKLQLKGYKKTLLSKVNCPTQCVSDIIILLTAIDNELQHHKMYSEFIQMGFTAKDFYNTEDSNTCKYIKSQSNNKKLSFKELFLLFLTFLGPGGVIGYSYKKNIQKQFYRYNINYTSRLKKL